MATGNEPSALPEEQDFLEMEIAALCWVFT